MTKASNLSDSESAARRRILFQFAKTNPSAGEFNKFVSDMRLLMPLPDDLILDAMNINDLQADVDNNSFDDTEQELQVKVSGLQILSDDGSPNLFTIFAGDLGDHIISYAATTSDLCTLDLVNNQFRELMMKQWEKIAYERFGMRNGKDGWRMGTSLLREPLFVSLNATEKHKVLIYNETANLTANNELVAVVTVHDTWGRYNAPQGVNLYDATDLTYLEWRREERREEEEEEEEEEERQGRAYVCKMTVAGPPENHLFISHLSDNFLLFNRGDIYRKQHYPDDGEHLDIPLPLIATDTHVIVVAGNSTKLHKIVPDHRLIETCQSELLQCVQECSRYDGQYYLNTIEWGVDQSEFVVYHSIRSLDDDDFHFSEISIWTLDADANAITRTQVFRPEIKLKEVVMGEDFIAGSCKLKNIHIWDRHTKEKTQNLLCDVEVDDIDELDGETRYQMTKYPLYMVCHGHMLVTTSYLGDAICVWNMKTGQLLKRYCYNYKQKRAIDDLMNEYDIDLATSMAYLKPLNSYLCLSGYLNVWTFPTNQQQKDTAMMISQRLDDFYKKDYKESDSDGESWGTFDC